MNKPDIAFDALNGLAFRDDSLVWRVCAQKVIAAGDELPHVEIRIATQEG